MHTNNYINDDDLICYNNNDIATTNEIRKEFCDVNVKTILIIYCPIGFIIMGIIIFKILEHLNIIKKTQHETKEIGLQCEFSILHPVVVIEPDCSLSIVCDSI